MAKKGYVSSFYPKDLPYMGGRQAGNTPGTAPDKWKVRAQFARSLPTGKYSRIITEEYPGNTGQTSNTNDQDMLREWSRRIPSEDVSDKDDIPYPTEAEGMEDYKKRKKEAAEEKMNDPTFQGMLAAKAIAARKAKGDTTGEGVGAGGYNEIDLRERLAHGSTSLKRDELKFLAVKDAHTKAVEHVRQLQRTSEGLKQQAGEMTNLMEEKWLAKGTRKGQFEADKLRRKIKDCLEQAEVLDRLYELQLPKLEKAQKEYSDFFSPKSKPKPEAQARQDEAIRNSEVKAQSKLRSDLQDTLSAKEAVAADPRSTMRDVWAAEPAIDKLKDAITKIKHGALSGDKPKGKTVLIPKKKREAVT